MDIRIKKTERAIREAFLALRAQKPLEKITVKELCAAAYINKSTFYAHYADLFALSDALEREAVDADRIEDGVKALVFSAYPERRDDPVMQIVLSYSIHGAYWAYTKNQAAGEAVLLEVIGRISGALRALY